VPHCKVWLHYTATIDWGIPPLSEKSRPYVSAAALTLRDADGGVLSSSHYVMAQGMRTDKWASTRDKVGPTVTALLTGAENVGFYRCLSVAPTTSQEPRHATSTC